MFNYFISYIFYDKQGFNGSGNTFRTLDRKILRPEDVKQVEQWLVAEYPGQTITVMGYHETEDGKLTHTPLPRVNTIGNATVVPIGFGKGRKK